MGFKKLNLGPVLVLGSVTGLGFCRFLNFCFNTDRGPGLVQVYVEKSGLGFSLYEIVVVGFKICMVRAKPITSLISILL